MALVECKECGEMISSKARTCPRCGAPRYGARLKSGLLFLFIEIAVGVLALIFVLWYFGVFSVH